MVMAALLPEADGITCHPEHYALRGRLGEGGFGEVYEAWDTRLQRSVAIKTIRRGASDGVDLVREARLAASLRHAAFVKMHAAGEDAGRQYIVMELVHGRTLKQILQAGGVPLANALDWVGQVADAMRTAHASGLVHGDIKPSNLMIEEDGRVRILDFGLALRQDTLATETVSLGSTSSSTQTDPQGTIAYMAPERLLGAAPDARADVYALGVILYELACGKRPFASLHGLALAAAQVQTSSDGWDYPDRLDTRLIALIRAMTARQPEQRVDGMDEVLRRLADLNRVDAPSTASAILPWLAQVCPVKLIGGVLLAAGLLGVGWWQGAPYLAGLQASVRDTLVPYSETVEMESGLAALREFDRPGSVDAAEHHFERILARAPNNAAAAAGMSLVYGMRFGSDRQDETWLSKADASAQQAEKLDDQLALAHVAMAAVRESQGRYDEALAICARALHLDPANFYASYFRAETLRRARRYPEARAALAEAARRFPRERVFADELGSVEYEQGNLAAAEQAFRHSIALQPDAVTAYANLAAALMRQNRADEAARVLQQGLQVRPSDKLYTNLGNILFLRGDYVGAAAAFEDAVSPTRGNPRAYLNWANLADTLLWIPGRRDEARQAYDKARRLLAPRLERAPNDVLLVSRMGLYAARAGDADQALALMARALTLAPDGPDVQFRAGLAYELLGRRKLALDAIARALRLGYPLKFLEAEPDLVALRRDPGYHAD
jgi:serine/threonine-protein kinase